MTLGTVRQSSMNWLRPVSGPVRFEGIFEVLPIELGRRVTHQSGSFRWRKRGLLPFIPWRTGGIELASLPGTPSAPDRCRGAGHRSECTYAEGMRSSASIASAPGFRSHPVVRSVTRPASTRALWSLGPLARPEVKSSGSAHELQKAKQWSPAPGRSRNCSMGSRRPRSPWRGADRACGATRSSRPATASVSSPDAARGSEYNRGLAPQGIPPATADSPHYPRSRPR